MINGLKMALRSVCFRYRKVRGYCLVVFQGWRYVFSGYLSPQWAINDEAVQLQYSFKMRMNWTIGALASLIMVNSLLNK